MIDTAISVRGVSRRFGEIPALNDVNIEIPKGSVTGLIGRNGAGKTTLLSILATLDDEFDGEVSVASLDVKSDPFNVRRTIGFVADETRGSASLSVERYLHFFARAFGFSPSAANDVVDEALARVGLAGARTTPSTGLSRGMGQRLAVARALLHKPTVLLLDEPASGLDPRARIELKEILKSLAASGVTIIVSSHILTELGDVCDRMILIDHGRVMANGPLADLYSGARGETGTRRVVVELLRDAKEAHSVLRDVRGSDDVSVLGSELSFTVETMDQVAEAIRALVEHGHSVVRVTPEKDNLEALFLALTRGEET